MGDITFVDISVPVAVNSYLAFMFGGMLRKIGCHIRPYENMPGTTDGPLRGPLNILYDAFLTGGSKEEALDEVMALFKAIDVTRTRPAEGGDIRRPVRAGQ